MKRVTLGEPTNIALPCPPWKGFLMGFWVYILQSQSCGRYYCGQTDDIEKRLDQHNDPENTFTRTTSRFKGPWRLIIGNNFFAYLHHFKQSHRPHQTTD
jgi:hypothetical protein